MTTEIPKEDWTMFFDGLSKRRFEWESKIEIMNKNLGDQVLVNGLPLFGITAEPTGNGHSVEIMVGIEKEQHQTHTITNPARIAYLSQIGESPGVVEIEEENGTKTLIHLIQPLPIRLNYLQNQEALAGSQ